MQSIRTGPPGRLTSSRTLAGMLTDTDDISAHWNTRLFHWNTRASPSVPDQIVTQRPESHNAHTFSVICDGRKILERWNAHLRQPSPGPAGPSSAPRCHEGVWRRCLRRHSLFTCLKNCSSERSSVPVRRRPRRIALKTCANEVSGDYRFCILEHSLAQRVFQPVPVFQQGGQVGR